MFVLAVAWADLVHVKVGQGELTHLVSAKVKGTGAGVNTVVAGAQ